MTPAILLSVIVPCYNEEKNIPAVVENFGAVFGGRDGVELLLVDNGSKDGTGPAMDRQIKDRGCSFARKVTVPENRGYGYGILAGLREARGEILAWTHADLQTDPADVLKAWEIYTQKSGQDSNILVKGHRRKRKFAEKFFSLGMQITASLALGTWLEEINAQPKLFPRSFMKLMKDPPFDFSLDLYLLYLAKSSGYRLVSFPVYFRERRFGEAKGGGSAQWQTRKKLILRSFRYIFELAGKVRDAKKEKIC